MTTTHGLKIASKYCILLPCKLENFLGFLVILLSWFFPSLRESWQSPYVSCLLGFLLPFCSAGICHICVSLCLVLTVGLRGSSVYFAFLYCSGVCKALFGWIFIIIKKKCPKHHLLPCLYWNVILCGGQMIIYSLYNSCTVRNIWLAADNLKLVFSLLCLKSFKALRRGKMLLCDASLVSAAIAAALPGVQGPPWTRSCSSAALHGSPLSFGKGFEAAGCFRKDQGVGSSTSAWLRNAANSPARKPLRADPALSCLLLSASFTSTTTNTAKLSKNTRIAWAIQMCGDGQQAAK